MRIGAIFIVLLLAFGCRGPLPDPIDLVLTRADTGQPFSFADHRGETLVVFFTATWCIPCQAMEPFLGEVAAQGAAEGIRVVAVAVDREGRRTVGPYVLATRPPYPVLVGGMGVAEGRSPFGKIPELPATMILDRRGRPAATFSGVADSSFILDRARTVGRR